MNINNGNPLKRKRSEITKSGFITADRYYDYFPSNSNSSSEDTVWIDWEWNEETSSTEEFYHPVTKKPCRLPEDPSIPFYEPSSDETDPMLIDDD